MPYIQNASDFLIQAIIGFALYVVLLRFWMQWVRADFRNPIGQFIITVTNPVVLPLRKILPSIGNMDTATILLAYVIGLVKIFAYLILREHIADPLNYIIWGIGLFIKASIYLFIAAILIQVIASWINPNSYHPIVSIAHSIGNLITAPVRRIIPPLAGLDFSPLLVLLLLQFSLRLLVAPILPLGV